MLAWENSGFSVDASVRITLIDRDVPSYFRSLEHLLRYCARPPFALERLSVTSRPRRPDRTSVRYMLPRHKAANWVGPGRGRKSTRPGANGVVELTPFEFLDRLADLVPPPRKHRHRYHGVFAPNHKLRPAVTALAKRAGDWLVFRRNRCLSPSPRHSKRDRHRLLRTRSQSLARHLTDCVGEADGPGGGGVSARVPELWRRYSTQRRRPAGAGPLRTGGSQAGEGQDGFARVKSAPHASWRTARAAARLAGPGPAHRLGRARAGP